ncbi:hypothetical protein ACHAPJ_007956 [Fusarium lateritium]
MIGTHEQNKDHKATPGPSQDHKAGEIIDQPEITHDAVFGSITEDGPNYRNVFLSQLNLPYKAPGLTCNQVGWIGTSVLMMKAQIGLGVLSIPAAFDILGLVPGVLCLIAIAIITTWSNYMVGVFKINHREVYGIDDVGSMLFGRIGREILGAGFTLYLVFGAGAGMLGTSVGLNSVSTHGACTAIFVAVAAAAVICLASIRTLGRLSFLAWLGLICLLVAISIVTIAVGVQDRPDEAPQTGTWVSDYKIIGHPTFTKAISAISTFIFAYAGTPLFFPIIAEMRDPRHYTKALVLCQTVVTITYVTVGIIVYYFCGSYVASPALGSAGKTIKQIAYGIALPGLVISATLSTHVASKYPFVRILRGSRHLVANTPTHWITWIGSVSAVAITAYVVASGIPVFNELVSLVGALPGTLQCFQPMGCMWLYDNWSRGKKKDQPIPPGRNFRLLKILPGLSEDGLACELFVSDLDNATVYTALSYVWGNPDKNADVKLSAHVCKITQSLSEGLHRLRKVDEVQIVWADAICINQNDNDEKGHQVDLMGAIYDNAHHVLVWLGPDLTASSVEAFRCLQTINYKIRTKTDKEYFTPTEEEMPYQPVSMKSASSPEPVQMSKLVGRRSVYEFVLGRNGKECVGRLFDLSWFSRVWVLQEVGLASSATAFWGDASIDFSEIASFIWNVYYSEELKYALGPEISEKLGGAPLYAVWNVWSTYDKTDS